MNDLSRTEAIYHYIIGYQLEHQRPPTVREIRDGCGISSTSIVSYHLKKLEDRNQIERTPRKSRAIKVL